MTTATQPAVSFDRVTKAFGDKPEAVYALDDISFTIPTGSIYGVVGTSGAGKSTLLRTVNGLETPTSGTVTVLGEHTSDLSKTQLRRLRREVSMVFQHYNLIGSKTVAENVGMPLVLAGVDKKEQDRRVAEALALVGLGDRATHRPAQLSGGQRQRVGIARALVTNPKVLLCDEPTSALDPLTTAQILDLLVRINEELGLTIIIITHQMDVIARIADYVAVLEHGRLIENGPVEQVFAHPQQLLTRRFIETVVPQSLPDSALNNVPADATLVRVVHSGGAARELLSTLPQYGVTPYLLHAADAPLRRTTVGTLVLGLQGRARDVDNALAHINHTDGLEAEVLP